MPSPLFFFRPFRYDRVARVAVVETGPTHLFSGVVDELRRLFPDAALEALVREEDAALVEALDADRVQVVRFEERAELTKKLQAEPFDLIVMQLSQQGASGLRALPFALRGRSVMAFNDSLDHFPVNVWRLGDLARHFGLAGQGAGVLVAPLLALFLVFTAAWIHLRGRARRLARVFRGSAPRTPRSESSAPRARSQRAAWPG